MQAPSNNVFISYRRSVNFFLVDKVYQTLRERGIDVFYDVELIKVGSVDEIISREIAARPYFMPILMPGTLDRCVDPNDWVRREIEMAKQLNRLFVPLCTPDFDRKDFSKYLPHLANYLEQLNTIPLPNNNIHHFKYAVYDIADRILTHTTIQIVAEMSANTDDPLGFIDKTAAAMRAHDYKEAINHANEAIREGYKSSFIYILRANAYRFSNNLDQAYEDADTAVDLDPANADAYAVRANVFRRKSDFVGALMDADKALKLDNSNASAYYCLADINRVREQWNDALSYMEQSLMHAPNNPFALGTHAALLRNFGRYMGSLNAANAAIELYNSYSFAWLQKAETLQYMKDYPDALACATQTINIGTSREELVRAYVIRGSANMELHELRTAYNDAEIALAIRPEDVRANALWILVNRALNENQDLRNYQRKGVNMKDFHLINW